MNLGFLYFVSIQLLRSPNIQSRSHYFTVRSLYFFYLFKHFGFFVVEFGETVAAQCADQLKNNTRPLQLAIMNTLLKVMKRLVFVQLHASHKQQLKYILSHVKRTLHFSFGVF